MERRSVRGGLVLCAGLVVAGCSWVSLSEGGRSVRIAEAGEVSGCTLKGHASAQTRHQIGIISRAERSIREELDTLARNEAAEMGGDTVVATGPPDAGRQSFDVYRCMK